MRDGAIDWESDEMTSQIEELMAQNRWLSEEVKRRVDQLAAINSVAAVVSQSLDLEVTLQTALEAVMRAIRVEATGISLVDESGKNLVLRAQRGWKRDFVKMGMSMHKDQGLAWYTIEQDEVVVTGDVSNDPRIVVPAFLEEGVMAMALAPMHARGRIIGILSAMSYNPYEFSAEELTVLQAVADQVGVALDNAQLHGQVVRSESRLRAVLNSTADGILAIDLDGHVTLINSEAGTFFGVVPDDLLGGHYEDIEALPESLVGGMRQAMQRQQKGTTALDGTMPGNLPLEMRYLSYLISPVHDQTGAPRGWVVVIRDVTHIKQVEILKSQAIQHASHDLRNPLSVTLSALRLFSQTCKALTEQQQTLLDMALSGVLRMQTLVDDLLNLERIEAGVDAVNEKVNLKAVISEAVSGCHLIAEERGHTLSVDIPSKLPTVRGNADWLCRAVSNLLANAIKYTDNGGMIQVRVIAEKKQVKVEVEDNGRGIPSEAQGRLFERFYRVQSDEQEAVEGTGLGLAIVKSIVERHGGRVYVHSRPGTGSTFGFILPLKKK